MSVIDPGSVFVWLRAFCCSRHSVQRHLLARSDKEVIRGVAMGVAACVPVGLLFMLLAALLRSHDPFRGEVVPSEGMVVRGGIVPCFIKTHLPVGLRGMVLAALVAVDLSSPDSDPSALAAMVINDFVTRLRPRQKASGWWWGRGAVIYPGAASILLAIPWTGTGNASPVAFSPTMTMIFPGAIEELFALDMLFHRTTAQDPIRGASLASCSRPGLP